jgi:serine/threonine-protein kinase
MPPFELRTLGTPALLAPDGSEVAGIAPQGKRFALLVYVAIAGPEGVRRDQLLALFWPELDQAHARNALRQTLSMLRFSLGPGAVPMRRDGVVRAVPDRLRTDLLQFEAAFGEGDLTGALALYRGDFLSGFHLTGLPDLERWIEDRRAQLRRRAVRAALELAERSGGATAESWAHRAVALAPHEERAWQKLIEVQFHAGNPGGAIATYRKLCTLLADEFGLGPSDSTRALINSMGPRPTT